MSCICSKAISEEDKLSHISLDCFFNVNQRCWINSSPLLGQEKNAGGGGNIFGSGEFLEIMTCYSNCLKIAFNDINGKRIHTQEKLSQR